VRNRFAETSLNRKILPMNRNAFKILIATCAWISLIFVSGLTSVQAAERPNIVFVLFDDMGWGQPQSYIAESALRTPNLDKLAKEGMRFTDAHSASAVCTPTRYGLLTGRYPWRIGQFGVLTTYSKPIIPPERMTVASLLKQQGYTTACIGKWHLGMNWLDGKPGKENKVPIGAKMTGGPNAIGFDYFYGFTHARNIGTIIEQDQVVAHVEPVENQPLMIRQAVQWIDDRAKTDEPFFLYFPMCPPHTPVVPAAEFVGKSGAEDLVKQDPKYGDWVYQGDAMLGQIVESLERNGLAKNTLLIVTSDNGAEHRVYAPLRDSKRSIYEGGHRVPFVASWLGKIKPGTVNDSTICLNDLMATIADILDVSLPEGAGEDSVSLLPQLLGTTDGSVREATVHQSHTGDLAIRQGPWKAIFHKNGRRELFQLENDLGETNDLLATHSAEAENLTELLQSYIDLGRSTSGAAQKNDFSPSLAEPAGKSKR
jgi:arylsulfatase A-like enzyme